MDWIQLFLAQLAFAWRCGDGGGVVVISLPLFHTISSVHYVQHTHTHTDTLMDKLAWLALALPARENERCKQTQRWTWCKMHQKDERSIYLHRNGRRRRWKRVESNFVSAFSLSWWTSNLRDATDVCVCVQFTATVQCVQRSDRKQLYGTNLEMSLNYIFVECRRDCGRTFSESEMLFVHSTWSQEKRN